VRHATPAHVAGRRIAPWRVLCLLLASALVAPACIGDGDEPEPKCDLAKGHPAREGVELSCDGLDNDCDGRIDVLLPVDGNRCQTGAKGACALSYRVCRDGGEVCPEVTPTHETWDGIDNDCNGVVDDVPPGYGGVARARVLVPPYLWLENHGAVYAVRNALDAVGIPYDADTKGADFEQALGQLGDYNLVVMPGYTTPSYKHFKSKHVAALEAWVRKGGVLVWFHMTSSATEGPMGKLAGVVAAKRRLNITRISIAAAATATVWLDAEEEREFTLSHDPDEQSVEAHIYLPDLDGVSTPFMSAWQGETKAGVVGVRRSLEQGVVYTLGVDFLGYPGRRCHINCFDPGRDRLAMMLKGAWREANAGHMVVKHTVPGVEDAVFIASHDVDAPDANSEGAWGEPGALQMARMEHEEGVRGTYFVTTDIVANYYDPAVVADLCECGMCPQGGHSILHADWSSMPKGDCKVTEASYNTGKPTICGEVSVNLQILRETMGKSAPLSAWRTPYLLINPHQFEVLHQHGVRFDSSIAMGDARTNLPFAGHRFPYDAGAFDNVSEMWEFPVVIEDGLAEEGKKGAAHRLELHRGSWPRFRALWAEAILKNADNNAWIVSLVHPSRGVGEDVTVGNVAFKVEAARWAIRQAKNRGLKVMRMIQAGEFWRGRDGVRIEARYDEDLGYTGTLRVGEHDAPRFSLAFGDHIESFQASGAGSVKIAGSRVVFDTPLPAKGVFPFKAVVARDVPKSAP